VPDPPGNVDFTLFNDPKSPNKTARDRLTAHSTNAVCAGCHRVMDPIGLALEKIDGAGQLRKTENGVPIDASGDLDGVKYDDTVGLGKALHDNPAVSACVVKRLYAYATGRVVGNDEKELLKYYEQRFAADGYRIPDLLRSIAESDAFLTVSNPETGPKSNDKALPGKSASSDGAGSEKENKS
jgi:hypothetical protein